MSNSENEIRFHLEVPGWESRHMPINVLIELLKATELVLKAIALEKLIPGYKRQGKFPKMISESIQLELIGWEDGSTTPVLALRQSMPLPMQFNIKNLPEKTIEEFGELMRGVSLSSKGKGFSVSDALESPINGIVKIRQNIKATSFDIAIGKQKKTWISLPEKTYLKISAQTETKDTKDIVALGIIREIDEKDKTAELHEPTGKVAKIKFSEDLFCQMDAARWKPVNIIGIRKRGKKFDEIMAKEIIIQDISKDAFWNAEAQDDFQNGSGKIDYNSFRPFPDDFDFDGFMKALQEV